MRLRKSLRGESGMSLVEMLISVILLFILLSGVLFMFEYGLINAKEMQQRSILNVDAGNTMEKMVRQIRCVSRFNVPGENSPIDFFGDVRGSGTDAQVIFFRNADGNELKVTEKLGSAAAVTYTIAPGVTALAFRYYDADGQAMTVTDANRTSINRVDISFTMQRTVGAKTVAVTRTASVFVRSTLTVIGDDGGARS